jgi:putative endonuclease
MFHNYVLISKKDDKMYTGFTKNLKLRLEQHKKGLVPSTKNRRPLKLIYCESCLNRKDAMHREKYLKTFYDKLFLKNRIKSYLTGFTPSNNLQSKLVKKHLTG